MKRCLTNVINLLNSELCEFFSDFSSVMITYTDNYAKTLVEIMKEKELFDDELSDDKFYNVTKLNGDNL